MARPMKLKLRAERVSMTVNISSKFSKKIISRFILYTTFLFSQKCLCALWLLEFFRYRCESRTLMYPPVTPTKFEEKSIETSEFYTISSVMNFVFVKAYRIFAGGFPATGVRGRVGTLTGIIGVTWKRKYSTSRSPDLGSVEF